MKNLSDLLMNPQFKLEKLELVSLYFTAVAVRLKFTVQFILSGLCVIVTVHQKYCSFELK